MAKVFLVAHWDWVLYNFRLPLAKALREKGHEIAFVCPFGTYTKYLREAGFRCIHWQVVRGRFNPLRELSAVVLLAHIYRTEKPHLVHHFSVKPNIYGSIAAALVGDLKIVNTFTGLGFLFSDHPIAKSLRFFILPPFRLAVQVTRSWTVTQNPYDAETLMKLKVAIPGRLSIIVSSGVDVQIFSPDGINQIKINARPPIVLMASRLLWDKGVKEFVEVAQSLKGKGILAEFWLAGKPDDGNPMCIPEGQIREWQSRGIIRWLGHRDDMAELLRQVDIAVLPSHHEGAPRFLLEAAASSLPLVATDIPGCRVVVRDGINGFLVPPKDTQALAKALERLLQDPDLRARMGQASRSIAVQEFDERKIINQWLDLYHRLLIK